VNGETSCIRSDVQRNHLRVCVRSVIVNVHSAFCRVVHLRSIFRTDREVSHAVCVSARPVIIVRGTKGRAVADRYIALLQTMTSASAYHLLRLAHRLYPSQLIDQNEAQSRCFVNSLQDAGFICTHELSVGQHSSALWVRRYCWSALWSFTVPRERCGQ
jgi:hypothetical protein